MALTLRVCPGDRSAVVWVSGDVDVNVADAFQDLLLRMMRRYSPWLLVDLSGVPPRGYPVMPCWEAPAISWRC